MSIKTSQTKYTIQKYILYGYNHLLIMIKINSTGGCNRWTFFKSKKPSPSKSLCNRWMRDPEILLCRVWKKSKKNQKKFKKNQKINTLFYQYIFHNIYTHFITQKCSGATKMCIFFVYIHVLAYENILQFYLHMHETFHTKTFFH